MHEPGQTVVTMHSLPGTASLIIQLKLFWGEKKSIQIAEPTLPLQCCPQYTHSNLFCNNGKGFLDRLIPS